MKKLALDTLTTYWFTPSSDKTLLKEKVITLIDTVNILKDAKGEPMEVLFNSVLKKDDVDRNAIYAAKQISDTLVDYVFDLEGEVAKDQAEAGVPDQEKIKKEKHNQARLLSSLSSLSIISKIRPELIVRHTEVFLPHLSRNVQTATEVHVLNQVINMLERVIPLMEQPSEDFLRKFDEKICDIIKKKGSMLLIQSAIACLGAVWKQWNMFYKTKTKISDIFIIYLGKSKFGITSIS